jgi:hypothetical protein
MIIEIGCFYLEKIMELILVAGAVYVYGVVV